MKQWFCLFGMAVTICVFNGIAFGEDLSERLNALEDTIKSQAETIEELKEEVSKQKGSSPDQINQESQKTSLQLQQKVDALNDKVEQVSEAQKKEIPSVFNPSIGVVGETVFSYRNRGSDETGSDRPGGWDAFQRSVELNLAGAVDPFAKAYAVINASADAQTGEATLGVEEAALQTTSLPWNLEVKAGRFFGEFGRLGYIHDHELPFVNRPMALDQYIGGESRTDGIQINWLAPIEHYVSLTMGAGDQFGGDNPPNDPGYFRKPSGLNYWGRLSSYFELMTDVSVEPGVSYLWNPHTKAQWSSPDSANPPFPTDVVNNTYIERKRRLAGVDLTVSYKPLRDNQFKSLVWGTEVLYSDNRYDVTDPEGDSLPGRTVGAVGLYSYLTYKFSREWSSGFLYEWLESAVDKQAKTSAYSPYVTWALSHWNQLRLQYTHTVRNAETGLGSDDAVYLQWAWIIGAHSHGWQQR